MKTRTRIAGAGLTLFLLLCSGVATAADRSVRSQEIIDHAVWNNIPIKVVLPVGIERRIDFPVPVKIEWPDSIRDKTRNLQLRENGSVYWTAEESFPLTRVNVFALSGESWLLDVEARPEASARTLAIVDDRFTDDRVPAAGNAAGRSSKKGPAYDYDAVDLVRFAAQQLYAPRRLVKPLPGVVRVPVSTTDLPLYRGGTLRTAPIAQWKSPGVSPMFVTAVRVTAEALDAVDLDPRYLRGDWLSAAPQHGRVEPVGEAGNTTVWYLVSSRPFDEAAPLHLTEESAQ